jgi:superfamily II DNA or RNA helicase
MVQTLHSRPEILDEAKERFGLVLLDEAHHCPATTFTEVMQAFPAAYRYGLTATPERRDGLFPFLEAVIGPVRHEITNEDLRRAGVLVVPKIEYIRTDFSCPYSEWVDIVDALTKDAARNALALSVVEKALDDGRQVLALSERVAHVQHLAAMMESRRPGTTALAVGTMGKKAREEAIERMRNGTARVLFATKLADEGLNIPGLSALVLLTPSRDGARTMQRAGRTLRSVPGKPQPVIYDLADSRVGLLRSQARTRFFECYRHLAPGMRLPAWLDSRNAAA